MRRCIAFIILLIAATSVVAQFNPGDPRRAAEAMNAVAVHDWPDSPKRFADAQRMADAKEWRKSAELYQEIIEKFGDRLLPISPAPGEKQARYTSVTDAVLTKLSKWPDEGLSAYRAKFEPTAAIQRESAADDPIALHRVYSTYFITDNGKQAGMRLLDLYFEDGQFAAAAWTGQRLLELHPSLVVERPKVLYRTSLAFHLAGDANQAKNYSDELIRKYPNETGRVRGADVRFAESIATELAVPAAQPQALSADSWPTFAGSADRGRVSTAMGRPRAKLPYTIDLIKPNWKPMALPRRHELDVQDDRERAEGLTLGIIPAVDRGELFFQDGGHVYAVSLESGLPLSGWASTYGGDRRGVYTLGSPWGFPRNQQLSITVTDSYVLAIMGQRDPFGTEINLQSETRLVCLDRQTGRELWTAKVTGLGEVGTRSQQFGGSPLVVGDSVYTIARAGGAGPQFEDSYVLCFDLNTGKPRWTCYVASSTSGSGLMMNDGSTLPNDCSHLAYSGGRIFVATNLGAIAAVDALGGKLIWLSTYPRDVTTDTNNAFMFRGRFDPNNNTRLPSVRPWAYNAIIYQDGKLFALPSDARHVLIIDAASGAEIKRISLGNLLDADSLLAVVGKRLVTTGKHALGDGKFTGTVMCLNWETYDENKFDNSMLFWRSELPAAIFGRGFVTTDSVFVPTQERLLRISLKTGKLEETYPQFLGHWDATTEGPGNVIVSSEHVIVAGARHIDVYSDMSIVAAKLDREIEAAPDDPQPRLRYAAVLFIAGEIDKSIARLDEAIDRLGGMKSMRPGNERDSVFNNALTFAQKLVKSSRVDQNDDNANKLFDRAAAAAYTPSQQVAWRIARAKFARSTQDFAAEGRLYQEILADESLRSFTTIDEAVDGPVQAGELAQRGIEDLIKIGGRKVYEPFDKAAADAFTAAKDQNDPAKLLAVSRQYPNAVVAPQAMLAAADSFETAGDQQKAVHVLRQAYFKYPASDRARVLESMARVYLSMPNRLDEAIARLSQGNKQMSDTKLSRPLKLPDGQELSGVTFAQALTAVEKFRGHEAAAALPDFHLPPPLTAAQRREHKRQQPFVTDPPPETIDDVAALITPLREASRNDRVVTWSAAGGLSIYAVGETKPLVQNRNISEPPKKIAWMGSNLLAWSDSQIVALAESSGEIVWKTEMRAMQPIEVASAPSAVADEEQANANGNINVGAGANLQIQGNVNINVRGNAQIQIVNQGNRRLIVQNGRVVRVINNRGQAAANVPQAPQVVVGGPEAIYDVRALSDRAIVSTTTGRLLCIDLSDGHVSWQMRLIDRPIDRMVVSEDFAVVRMTDDFNVQLVALDSSTGQLLGRKVFSIESNVVPINIALSADGRMVYTTPDQVFALDLYEPWGQEGRESPQGQGNLTFLGADKPDQLLIADGRVLALSDNGQFVRMISLETLRTLRYFSPEAGREVDGMLKTATNQWNVSMRLVGAHLYLVSPTKLMAYNLDHLEQSWPGSIDISTSPNVREAFIGKDFLVLLDEPGAAAGGILGGGPLNRLHAFSRAKLKDNADRESGLLVYSHNVSDKSGIVQWQAVEGGFYYLSGDQKLHFLRGARE